MSVQDVVQKQYQRLVDKAAADHAALRTPPEGWFRTVRNALGMSGTQLAKRLGVTRARIPQIEQAELTGAATLKSMQAAAEAMGCRFVYAVLPVGTIQDVIAAQARKKAQALVGRASTHMALEDQALSNAKIAAEVERIAADLMREMPSNFWSDK
ncbi:mobile mystery protein A [Bradyrhizobium sp. LMTR 3]|uniref:mobile mystery protein A n=1 Tax=Bradyrhizobium sp. LMTR 3 TaxID=189873 RepID=UPI000810503E|nr:mobile mystery protein A [Bradyrhizobium sp. LMTR 3]OCK54154.1 transcriptional regulator [Bradyrhizobium sp. LMTR 3]